MRWFLLLPLLACSPPPCPPAPVTAPPPLQLVVTGEPAQLSYLANPATNPRCAPVEPESFTSRVVDSDGAALAHTATRNTGKPGFTIDVEFTPPRPGTYDVFLRIEPSLGTLQFPVAAAARQTTLLKSLKLPHPCQRVHLLDDGAALCQRQGALVLVRDGGEGASVPCTDFGFSSQHLWVASATALTRYDFDGGAFTPGPSQPCPGGVRVDPASDGEAFALCGADLDWLRVDATDAGFQRQVWGSFAAAPSLLPKDGRLLVVSPQRTAVYSPANPKGLPGAAGVTPAGQSADAIWGSRPGVGRELVRVTLPAALDGGPVEQAFSLRGLKLLAGQNVHSQPLASLDGGPARFTFQLENGSPTFTAYPEFPPLAEVTAAWVRAQDTDGGQRFYPR